MYALLYDLGCLLQKACVLRRVNDFETCIRAPVKTSLDVGLYPITMLVAFASECASRRIVEGFTGRATTGEAACAIRQCSGAELQ